MANLPIIPTACRGVGAVDHSCHRKGTDTVLAAYQTHICPTKYGLGTVLLSCGHASS